ncbi:MAG TPA: alanyl-tRNA editing protein [Spirochaetaceae bacterium]|nr:alanyl-tRNA editing protein [Spirochaetaceae bacterium]
MKTRCLFYEAPALSECDAAILELRTDADGRMGLVLDASPFYPEGGGQPCDLGSIEGQALHRVLYEGPDIVHYLAVAPHDGFNASPGQRVRCMLDERRRRDHTEQHSAQHLLSATVLRLLGGPTRSFHLGEDYCSVDIDLPSLSRDDADAVELAVLEAIREGYPVITHLCPPEDPASFPLRRKPPEGEAQLRILEIDGLDYTPCAGTHVRNTAELGLFRLVRWEKYKGMTRLYFLAGLRAYADYRATAAELRNAAAAAGTHERGVAAALAEALEANKGLGYKLKEAQEAEAAASARLMSLGQPDGPLSLVLGDGDFLAAMRLAKALASEGRLALIASGPDLKLAIGAPAAGPDVAAALKDTLKESGAKGGGGASFFQAAFGDRTALERFMEDALCKLR